MGRMRALAPFSLAVVMALAASFLIYNWLQQKSRVPPVLPKTVTEDTVNVALAKGDYPWGTKLTSEMIKLVPFPKGHLPSGSFSDAGALQGRILVSQIRSNEPILEYKLAPRDITAGGVCAVVQPGKRAMAVAGDKVIGMAGFIQPGNRVDILSTVKDPNNKGLHITKVVLEDILVLAAGTQVHTSNDGSTPAPVDVFTLELTPEEAERLAIASSEGKLHFALRNVTDKETVYTLGASIPDMLDAYRPQLQPASEPELKPDARAELPEPRRFKMEVINGASVQQLTF